MTKATDPAYPVSDKVKALIAELKENCLIENCQFIIALQGKGDFMLESRCEPGVKLYAAHILEMEVRLNTVDKFRGAEEPEQLNQEEGK